MHNFLLKAEILDANGAVVGTLTTDQIGYRPNHGDHQNDVVERFLGLNPPEVIKLGRVQAVYCVDGVECDFLPENMEKNMLEACVDDRVLADQLGKPELFDKTKGAVSS